jgi:hypothetical protein
MLLASSTPPRSGGLRSKSTKLIRHTTLWRTFQLNATHPPAERHVIEAGFGGETTVVGELKLLQDESKIRCIGLSQRLADSSG